MSERIGCTLIKNVYRYVSANLRQQNERFSVAKNLATAPVFRQRSKQAYILSTF